MEKISMLQTLQNTIDDYNEWASRERNRFMTEYSLKNQHNDLKGILYNKLVARLLTEQYTYLQVLYRKDIIRKIFTTDLVCTFEKGGFLSKLMIPKISAQDSGKHIPGRALLINALWGCLDNVKYEKTSTYQRELNDIVNGVDIHFYKNEQRKREQRATEQGRTEV